MQLRILPPSVLWMLSAIGKTGREQESATADGGGEGWGILLMLEQVGGFELQTYQLEEV